MELPIDVRKAPFKRKYLDEETNHLAYWMEFGGDVVIAGPSSEDVFTGCTKAQMDALIEARRVFVDAVCEIVNATPA